ncbi:PAS domain-containing hybrid sensor histidine kinase/response regulator [Noviherbaspirillum autotrophicum]|uniref:PAS domain-containing hybrid sensor histidine kinase/response regulator n=1 Tax=Noviherbaspirillum autotrophicum TaxID=709839 RepID=UPI000A4AB981|nr:PAS domain-containing protein [Noviherbaspirillum autotrophicum]
MGQDSYVAGEVIAGIAFALLACCLAAAWYRLRGLRQTALQTRRALEEMEMAYAHAPLGLAMLDRDLRYIRINKLLAQLNGVSARDHIGKTVRDVVPDVARQAEDLFRQVLRTGKPQLGIVFEGATSAQPGVPRFWRENIYPILADDGCVVGINVAVEDVTEEKRLHDALQASELRERQRASELEVVMNATPAAIFLARDRACDQVIGNAEGNRMLHLKPDENASANPIDRRPYRDAGGAPVAPDQLPMQRAAATGKEVRGVELTYRFDSGEEIHLLANAAPLLNEAGEVFGAVGAFIDITAQKAAAQVVMRESQRKDEFLATLAHELRNPLASIQNGLELMKLVPAGAPAPVRVRAIVERQLSHLVRLIDDLLDVSRINTGKLELKKRKIALRAIIDNAMEVCRPHIEASGHTCEVCLPGEPLYVEADLMRMEQVVCNLLNNAVKYTSEGGRITVAVSEECGNAVIRVSDNGIGIDRAMLPKVFEMFGQAEDARERRKGGLGIGLSLARQLTEMHDGTLTADSAGLGTGSTFTVRLPLCHDPADGNAGPAARAPLSASSRERRILILDDNVDAAHTLGTLFEIGGHRIALAYNGRDAVRVAREFHPEIAFLDIGLPDISGLDVARQLRREQALQRSRLVALTGWDSEKDRADCKEAGFDFHLTKPVTIDAIKGILPDLKMPSAHG